MATAKLPEMAAGDLLCEVEANGAKDVSELSLVDWEGLPAWSRLRPVEARRVAAAVVALTSTEES